MKLNSELLKEAESLYSSGKTFKEVAAILSVKLGDDISWSAVRKRFIKLDIPIRNLSQAHSLSHRKHLPVTEILRLYDTEKISLKKLAKKFGSSKGTLHKVLEENGFRVRGNDEAILLTNRKHERQSFDGKDEEKAYMVGFVEGDVTAFRRSKHTIRAITNTTHEGFLDVFESLFKGYAKVRTYPAKNRTFGNYMWTTSADLDNSFDFLLLENRKRLISELVESERNVFLSFLAGYFDAEGSLLVKKIRENLQCCMRIGTENKTLLGRIKRQLREQGFNPILYRIFRRGDGRDTHGVSIRYSKDYFALEIFRKADVRRMLELLPLRHPEKTAKKELILEIIGKNITRWKQVEPLIVQIRDEIKAKTMTSMGKAKRLYEARAVPLILPKGLSRTTFLLTPAISMVSTTSFRSL
ncbi:MAG: LAGLIDADG family homing endonuclease [Candidatus Aenigmatarchaeota archaeon]